MRCSTYVSEWVKRRRSVEVQISHGGYILHYNRFSPPYCFKRSIGRVLLFVDMTNGFLQIHLRGLDQKNTPSAKRRGAR